MSGYRETSAVPAAREREGGPQRPFNWLQWVGVALIAIGTLFGFAVLAGALGLFPRRLVDSAMRFPMFPLIGMLLINSRRNPAADPAPELAPQRRRMLSIVSLGCAVVLIAATLATYLGA